jgi:hypothetical protein
MMIKFLSERTIGKSWILIFVIPYFACQKFLITNLNSERFTRSGESCSKTAISPASQNPFTGVDMDILGLAKTLGTGKVLVPRVRSHLTSVE